MAWKVDDVDDFWPVVSKLCNTDGKKSVHYEMGYVGLVYLF